MYARHHCIPSIQPLGRVSHEHSYTPHEDTYQGIDAIVLPAIRRSRLLEKLRDVKQLDLQLMQFFPLLSAQVSPIPEAGERRKV